MDARKRWDGGKTHWGAGVPRYRTSASNWSQPVAWNKKAAASGKPWRVFCASLADVFDNEVPTEWVTDLWGLINDTPNLEWLLVTKRIGNAWSRLPLYWLSEHGKWPSNVRLLITVCNQEEADRDIPKLLALPCKNGLSIEPQLGPIDLRAVVMPDGDSLGIGLFSHGEGRGIEWVIVGGESGSKARPFDLAWARSAVAQGKAAEVPVFVKQLGSSPCVRGNDFGPIVVGAGSFRMFKDRAGADPAEWPADLRVRQFPT